MTEYLIQFGKDILEGIKPQIQAQAWFLLSANAGVFAIVHVLKGFVKTKSKIKGPRVIQAMTLGVGVAWMIGAGLVSPSGEPANVWVVRAVAVGIFLGASNVAIYDGWKWWQKRKEKSKGE